MKQVLSFLVAALALAATAANATPFPSPPADPASSVLWYERPARTWMTEALPIGGGSLGAMLFGLTEVERLQFNHNTLWTGHEKDTGAYQAFGDVYIRLGHAAPADYRRDLDLDRATATVTYRHQGVTYRRTAFASHPAGVIVYHFTADKPGSYSGRLWLAPMHQARVAAEADRLDLEGRLGRDGLRFAARVRVMNAGGRVRADRTPLAEGEKPLAAVPEAPSAPLPADSLVFENCDSLTLVLAADTDYAPERARGWRGEAPAPAVARRVDAVAADALSALHAAHIADHQSLYRRFRLELGATAPELAARPTDRRLLAYTEDRASDPDLEELVANYGRYLLIACSRPGGLPANLQGLWNNSNNPPWRSDYHSNINVQMNYWPAEPANLAECHRVFLDYVVSQIPVYRERTREERLFTTAKRGWTVRTENGVFGGGSWKWNPPGSAWYALHFWEHYAFSRDQAYLRDVAYPVLKEVVEFWEDFLVARPDGTLVTPLGWSPEHGPEEHGVSYDQQIVHDLFTNYLEAADILGVDRAYRERVADLRSRLLGPKIGKWGQLQEWETDRDDPKDRHRHVSHLFALHPGRQITASGTPELFQAAKVSLGARGDEGTGWSRAWKINFWARLREGDRAYRLLRNLLAYTNTVGVAMGGGAGLYPNLLDSHPPFQIDGNLGATAGVCEMLVQSHAGAIELLPALPSAWSTGSVTGLRARGGFTLDLSWKAGRMEKVRVTSAAGTRAKLRYGDRELPLALARGRSAVFGPADFAAPKAN